MINISERPAEADDRAVPGHWEGDLIIGKNNASAIGTLVERTTGYTMLVHLPDGYKPEQVRDALAAKIQTIPEILRASLTWDQGPEMRDWQQVSVAADIDIYFCDPHAPWQRGTNENTNGLLRQYFPKGTDLSVHSAIDLDWVATELNDRPRKRLGFASRSRRSDHYCCDDRQNPPIHHRTRLPAVEASVPAHQPQRQALPREAPTGSSGRSQKILRCERGAAPLFLAAGGRRGAARL